MPKVIFLKDIRVPNCDNYFPKDLMITYKKGHITDGRMRDYGIVINHKWFSKEEVMTLSEFREQRINSILNEDN